MSQVVVVEISPLDAQTIWEDSPHATVFTKPNVLKEMVFKVSWFAAKRGNELLCCWPVCMDEHGNLIQPNFSYFVGPLWSKQGWHIPNHRLLSKRTEVYEAFIKKFEEEFSGFTCSLPLGLTDVRVFDWWNYHNHDKSRISISPKYTAQINFLDNGLQLEKNYRELRRRELRKVAKSEKFILTDEITPEVTYALYVSTMLRQSESIALDVKKSISSLHKLVSDGYGFLSVVMDKLTGDVAYMALILRAKGVSNLILNLTNELYRGSGVSAYGIDSSIKKSISLGDIIFDFNGANSPQRGDDKHSYGAEEKLFFDLNYRLVK